MRNKSLLLASLMLICAFSLFAQTYDLTSMDENTFKNRGGDHWNFERYTYATGEYKNLYQYTDSSCVNWYDPYVPEWMNGVKLGEPNPSGVMGDHIWRSQLTYAWADSIRSVTRPAMTYWPYVSTDFEVYPTKQFASVISFKVPADGDYIVDYAVQRMHSPMGALKALSRFRYSGENSVNAASHMGNIVEVGAGSDEIAGWADDRENNPRYEVNPEQQFKFAFNAKAGDIVSFEIDCRHLLSLIGNDWAREAYARTQWKKLTITKVEKSEAQKVSTYCEPYGESNINDLYELLEEIDMIQSDASIGNNYGQYPQAALDKLISYLDEIPAEGSGLNNMNALVYIEILKQAIDEFEASKIIIQFNAEGNHKLFPVDADKEEQHEAIFSKVTPSVWDFGTHTVASGTYKFYASGEGGEYGKSDRYANSNSWFDSKGEWFYIAADGFMHPTTAKSPVIFFTAPVDGIYKVGASIKRGNPEKTTNSLWARFRFLPKDSKVISKEISMGFDKEYGKQSVDPVDADFFVNMKAGDRITFEEDCYTPNTNSSAGSSWTRLYVITTENGSHYFTLADANASEAFYNPYTGVGDFTELNDQIRSYENMLTNVTIGDAVGNYPAASKTTFEAVIKSAKDLVDAATASQVFIDAKLSELTVAYTAFQKSRVYVISSPTDDALHKLESGYYYIKNRTTGLFLTSPAEYPGSGRAKTSLQPIEETSRTNKTGQVWYISYNPYNPDPARYSIVTELNNGTWTEETDEAGHMNENGEFMAGGTEWVQVNEPNWRNFSIYYDTDGYSIFNLQKKWSMVMNATEDNGTYTTTYSFPTDQEFIWDLIKYDGTGSGLSVDKEQLSSVVFSSVEGGINISGISNAAISVYSLAGVAVKQINNAEDNTFIPLAKGMYIVKVIENGQSIAKIVMAR